MELRFRADLRKAAICIYAYNNTFFYSFLCNGIFVKKENIVSVKEASELELIDVQFFISELLLEDIKQPLKYDTIYKEWRTSNWLPEGTKYYFYDDIKHLKEFEKEHNTTLPY